MLSYRHAFHAGNHADVLKHSCLAFLLASFKRKDKPFIYIDTHAGAGAYDLKGEWAKKTNEHSAGIAKLWQEAEKWPELSDYFGTINTLKSEHADPDKLRYYPGSPEIARQLMRPQDKLALIELHNNEVQLLRGNMRHDERIAIHHRDGFEALPALLPPTPRRGLVLIDPPYEQKQDYQQVVETLQQATKRWATGTYAIWYPILGRQRDHSQTMLRKIKQLGLNDVLVIELEVAAQEADLGMNGSGLIIVNTPWQLDTQMEGLLPRVCKTLETGAGAKWRVEWLSGSK